ncbi:hypothetical protein HDV01_006628 [Terramyces sp. JEL0728]|nr:hypothetical protein HDV01_006628 [Terramyces sp. JEL0728]
MKDPCTLNKEYSHSAYDLAETALCVRDAAKGIGKAILKLEHPSSVMIVAKLMDQKLVYFTRELARHLIDQRKLVVYIENKLLNNPSFYYSEIVQKHPHYAKFLKGWTAELCASQPDNIDFIITLGGDGTVLYTTWMFQTIQVPPIIPFHLGSLGFLTNFKINEIDSVLDRVVQHGNQIDGIHVNMRMRLSCTIWRAKDKEVGPVTNSFDERMPDVESTFNERRHVSRNSFFERQGRSPERDHRGSMESLAKSYDISLPKKHSKRSKSVPSLNEQKAVPGETFEILNDLVVDRGPSAYMSQLDLYVEEKPLTAVQADGLVVSTPTGSTAYSLAAGGSLVHPEVPSFLLTPICAHSLSFRPMLLPDSTELQIKVPIDSRSTAWASFDGRHRTELKQGDYIVVKLSRYPVPTVCQDSSSIDWFESLKRALHWNQRTRQKGTENAAFGSNLKLEAFGDEPEDLDLLAQDLFGLDLGE